MIRKRYVTCLWPGLTEIWWLGRLTALPYAIAFMLILNIYLVICFVYPDWLPSSVEGLIFWVGLPTWLLFCLHDFKAFPELSPKHDSPDTADLYNRALAHTLRKHHAEAEGLLTDMLAIEPRDPPALLLLAGLYRDTDRLEASNLLLHEMRRLEVADRWWLEIEAEQRRNNQQMSESISKTDGSKNASESLPDDN